MDAPQLRAAAEHVDEVAVADVSTARESQGEQRAWVTLKNPETGCSTSDNLRPVPTLSIQGAKWTYTGPDGEPQWPKKYPYCGGSFQSPIDIQTEQLRFDPTLRAVEVQNYELSPGEQLTLGNNGHSVQLSLPSKMHISSLPHRYTATQLHFHWGSSGKPAGSEHLINSRQYAAEMHIVHYNSDKYANMSMAVDKSDGLAVLGVLIEIGEFNPEFEQFLKFINGIKYSGQKIQVPGFNVRGLLPPRLDEYYRYDGSLTTPPCYPSVLWTVFRNHVTISRKQFLSLATALYSSHPQDSAPVPLNGSRAAGPLAVSSPLTRRRVIQQLLVGDLADLADEGLYQLLPSGSEKPGQKKDLKTLEGWSAARALRKKSQSDRSVRKLKLAQEALCYGALEQKVFLQLKATHSENQLAQTLRDQVFPELNLRSYLECKSELALPTIRHILRARRTDEAVELDHSLTRALRNHKPAPAAGKHGDVSRTYVPKKPHSSSQAHPWLLPMERED
ncbi:carbonic anhydrase 14 isoform 3-T3 [Synchiropus picturatus]